MMSSTTTTTVTTAAAGAAATTTSFLVYKPFPHTVSVFFCIVRREWFVDKGISLRCSVVYRPVYDITKCCVRVVKICIYYTIHNRYSISISISITISIYRWIDGWHIIGLLSFWTKNGGFFWRGRNQQQRQCERVVEAATATRARTAAAPVAHDPKTMFGCVRQKSEKNMRRFARMKDTHTSQQPQQQPYYSQ